MLGNQKILLSIIACLLLAACAANESTLKPLSSKATASKILAKDPHSIPFQQYLIKQGYAKEQLPLAEWGLDELTLCALFYHSKLDVAKEQLALANLAIASANVRQKPTINADIAHSNQKNGDIKPWSYGLSIDIPIATNNKREISVEKTEEHAEAARMDVAETAWQLRNQIAEDLITYQQNLAEAALLEEALAMQSSISNMLEKRVSAGIASKTELSNVSLLALKTEHALNEKRAQSKLIQAKLAADVGLSLAPFSSLQIKPSPLDEVLANQSKVLNEPSTSKTLQTDTLLNRIDIRRSLINYAAAETEIRLQVANQVPDITLSPGILFDFGDSIWSLGFSSLLSSLSKNTTLIEKAKQLRAIQGAEFEHLQAEVIAQLEQAQVRYSAAKQTVQLSELQLEKQEGQLNKMQKQFNAGLISNVDLKKFILNNIVAKQQVLSAKFALLKTMNQIENVAQKPLYTVFSMPKLNNKQAQP